MSPKLGVISAIHAAGRVVEHWIHRHGLDEGTAFHVEAALIDAYPALTNAVRGHSAGAQGNHLTADLVSRYQAEPAEWLDPVLLVGVRLTSGSRSPYDAARYAWPLDRRKLTQIKYVLAVKDQRIIEAFQPTEWLAATIANFPQADRDMPGRLGFVGITAPGDVRKRYLGKRLPDGFALSQVGTRYAGV